MFSHIDTKMIFTIEIDEEFIRELKKYLKIFRKYRNNRIK